MSSESVPTPQCSTKQYYATNSPWEEAIGYYRAVRHDKNIYISGTTAVDPFSTPSNPRVLHPGDAAAQTRVTIDEIVKAIKALGGRGAESIVRTKMYVQRQQDCGPVGEVFNDMVGKGKGSEFGCAATMVVVGGFCDPEMLVEIECDAIADADEVAEKM
ncbi:YjgH family protein [Aureobasidium pullulans]|nr:YjgH family protein [Aureobasidium pullulans]